MIEGGREEKKSEGLGESNVTNPSKFDAGALGLTSPKMVPPVEGEKRESELFIKTPESEVTFRALGKDSDPTGGKTESRQEIDPKQPITWVPVDKALPSKKSKPQQ